MYRFIESVCCLEGELKLLDLHQDRMEKTYRQFFPDIEPLTLTQIISDVPSQGKYKCRVEYGRTDFSVEFRPYVSPSINLLQVVEDNLISYRYKSTDRQHLMDLFGRRGSCDDIIIVKNGLVTDSYFANLAFYDGMEWWTPERPLLRGVKREYLLRQGMLRAGDISTADLKNFQKVSLINAMLDLNHVNISTKKLTFS